MERNISCWDTVEPMAIEFVHVARTLSSGGVLGAQSWKSWLRIERNSAGFGLSQEDLSQRNWTLGVCTADGPTALTWRVPCAPVVAADTDGWSAIVV